MNNPYESLKREELKKLSIKDLIELTMEKQDELRELYSQIIENKVKSSYTSSIHNNVGLIDICIDNITKTVDIYKHDMPYRDYITITTNVDCIVGCLLNIESNLEHVEDKKE